MSRFLCLLLGHRWTDWMVVQWVTDTESGRASEVVYTMNARQESRICLRGHHLDMRLAV